MDNEVIEQLSKPERLRTRWTESLDIIFADLVVQQIRQGNRPNSVFDKKTWNHICSEFNRQTNLNFNNNQLRKHLDVLRARYQSLKSSSNQNDFTVDDSCYIGFDLREDVGVNPKHETSKIKDCPIYEQLCTIFEDSGADGKYAQSSHYEELPRPVEAIAARQTSSPGTRNQCPRTPSCSTFDQGNVNAFLTLNTSTAGRKRKHNHTEAGSSPGQRDDETIAAVAKALSEMVHSWKSRVAAAPQVERSFTITNCIKALDEIEGIAEHLYYAALDLFEEPKTREAFLSLSDKTLRLSWLQEKCGDEACFEV